MTDWLSAVIAGIIVLAIGFIINRVFSQSIIKKIGWVIMVAGGVIIAIGLILLVVMLLA